MAKDRDQELLKKYESLQTKRQNGDDETVKRNRMCVDLLLHGTLEDINALAKEHNRRIRLMDNGVISSDICETFLRKFGHRKGLFRYEKDGHIFYGPERIEEEFSKKEEYGIPRDAKLDRSHYIKSKDRMQDQDNIMNKAWSLGFEIVYQDMFDYEGIPHTEYIMYCPLYNATMHLEFDVAEELAQGYDRNKLTIIIPYFQAGKKGATIAPFFVTEGLEKSLETMSSNGNIASTYPRLGGDFPHFTNISNRRLIGSGEFSDIEAQRLHVILGLEKLAGSDESIKSGFGEENVAAATRIAETARCLKKSA